MSEISTLIEGKYDVIAKIREGGMGTIYKVRHRLLEEIRVVKVMRQSVVGDPELKRRFLEEARTATRLKHPNIATIYDFALGNDGTAYLVMEFIDGVTLGEILKSQGSLGLALSLDIAHQTLLALGYLHRKNVIHRDIAPDNLMLTYDEEGDTRIKLIDLGIAKVLDRIAEMTSTGVFLGKVRYASPEQYGALSSGETIDGRSDLYSLGLVLYELLTGRRPFTGETPVELLRAHVFQEPIPFGETDPENLIPDGVRAAVLKALEKRREDRFGSAQDFDREILALRSQFTQPYDTSPAQTIIALVRGSSPGGVDFVTPSAQDRLDRQFLAHPTPTPRTDQRTSPILDTVVDPEEKEALLLKEIREEETRGDLNGLEAVARACSAGSRAEQAVRDAILRLREKAKREKREAEAADWQKCSADGSEAAWQGYLNRHPDSFRREEAVQELSQARAFREALEAGTSQAWKAFVEEWPRSSHRGEADRRLQEARQREDAAFAATVISPQEKQARLLGEVREFESKKDLPRLEAIAQAGPPGSRVAQAAREAVLRLQETARSEKREAEEVDWRKCSSEGSEAAWQRYLEGHPDSFRREEAVRKLSEVRDFQEATKAGTGQAWQAFLEKWPEGAHRDEAERRVQLGKEKETAALASATEAGTADSFRDFLSRYPASPLAPTAQRYLEEQIAYDSALKRNTARSWQEFVSRWSSGRLSALAAESLQTAAQREADALRAAIEHGTSMALRQFLTQYSEAAGRSRAEACLQEALAFEAAPARGKTGWEQFLKGYPDGRHNAEARTALRKLYEIEAEEIEALLEAIRLHEEADRQDELELLEKKYPGEKHPVGNAARAALGRVREAEQRRKAAEAASEALRIKLEEEQERREAEEREREAAKRLELEARREREAAEQREREAAKRRELETKREREAAEQREREAAEKRELAAKKEREAEKQRRREVEQREREAARQQGLEAKRQREAEEAKPDVMETPGLVAGRGRRYAALAAAVLVTAVGAWILSHKANKSNVAREVPSQAIGGQPIEVPSPAPAAARATGSLVVDALPWAEVVRVEDSAGKNWLDGKQAYTPMMIPLPPGKYSVVFKNGDFQDRTVSASAEVREGTSTSCIGRFQQVDPAAYFKMEGWGK